MNAGSRFSSLRAAGEGAMAGGLCAMPMPIAIYFVEPQAAFAMAAYLAIGMSMGGIGILVAFLANRRARRPRTAINAETRRLADCEARCMALQAALMACANAAGPDTLRLVSAQYNMMLEYEKEKLG